VPPSFIHGIQLAREFHAEVVGPLLAAAFPDLRYAAGLLGPGSEVQGFDTERSTDHDWGPRLQVFLTDADAQERGPAIRELLASRLPESYHGYPVAFPVTGDPKGGAGHRVEAFGLSEWTTGLLGFDPVHEITLLDWLATPTQRLAEFTAGAVFRDDTGELARARASLAWYPRDVWLYLLACQWQRVSQEEPFPGRCAEAGDALGAAVVAARLARDLMRLCLLMRRRYPPYSKWLGSAFAQLPGSGPLSAALTAAISRTDPNAAQAFLSLSLKTAAAWHNELSLTPPLDTRTRGFYDRPYQVIEAGRFVTALRAEISDPRLRRLPLTGGIDQFVDSTDAVGDLRLLRRTMAEILA
jgi:hypothetical protein